MMIIRDKALAVLLGVLTVGVMVGCSAKPGPYRAKSVPPALENIETVVVLSKDLAKRVSVEGQRADRLPDNRLRVHVNIRNLTSKPLHVQAQAVFKDKDAISLGDETSWQPVLLNENATQTFTIDSMTDKAEFYTVRIREER